MLRFYGDKHEYNSNSVFFLFNKHLNASFLFGFASLSHLMLIAQSQFQVLPKQVHIQFDQTLSFRAQ